MEIKSELDKRISEIEKILEKYLPREEGYQKTIFEAMNYSVRAGGEKASSYVDAGNLQAFWRKFKSD